MEQNWAVKEAGKVKNKDVAILEKPDVKRYLDRLLLKRFWPDILGILEESNYPFYPHEKPKTEFELSNILARSLLFMLFDDNKAFFRGVPSCSREGWMLEREFYLSLARENDPQVVFEILGNSRFSGFPPTLTIDKAREDDFYQITFHAGSGAGWGLYDEKYVIEKIREVIHTNIELHELSKNGTLLKKELGEFLTIAYQAYEAY